MTTIDSPLAADEGTQETSPQMAAPETRRNAVVSFMTAALSFLLVAVPSTLGGLFFLDPILRKKNAASPGNAGGAVAAKKDSEGFIRLDVSASSVPADGTPVAVTIRDDIEDAWNRFVDVPVGSIWLRKNPDGGLVAFNSVCPHLGCSVNFRRSENDFFCPCHTSAFSLDGKKTNDIPPRNMDGLAVVTRTDGKEDPAGTEIWVRFQNFRRTTAEQIPL